MQNHRNTNKNSFFSVKSDNSEVALIASGANQSPVSLNSNFSYASVGSKDSNISGVSAVSEKSFISFASDESKNAIISEDSKNSCISINSESAKNSVVNVGNSNVSFMNVGESNQALFNAPNEPSAAAFVGGLLGGAAIALGYYVFFKDAKDKENIDYAAKANAKATVNAIEEKAEEKIWGKGKDDEEYQSSSCSIQ